MLFLDFIGNKKNLITKPLGIKSRALAHARAHTQTQTLLTFDTNEHELVVRQSAVVGHHLRGLDAAQADFAEVLLAGEAGEGHVGQVRPGVFGHCATERVCEWAIFVCFYFSFFQNFLVSI